MDTTTAFTDKDVPTSWKKRVDNFSREPIYFYLTGKWYQGNVPSFYDTSKLEAAKNLEDNYEAIKKEILAFYDNQSDSIKPMYHIYDYKEDKYRGFNFYGSMLSYPENLQKFPVLSEVLKKIPDMVTAQILVLGPHSRIKAHFSGSNAIIRNHLALVVPGKYPDLGIRVRQEERCWEEGKVLALCESHRHYAWNNTDKDRIILLVDTIHPDYADLKLYVCSGKMAELTMIKFAARFPVTKKIPSFMMPLIHKMLTVPFALVLLLHNKFNLNITSYLHKLKF